MALLLPYYSVLVCHKYSTFLLLDLPETSCRPDSSRPILFTMVAIKLFVGNLPENCPDETIRDLFSPYGSVEDVVIIKNYGFVKFANEDDAAKAAKDLNQSKLSGKTIIVEASKPKRDQGDNRDGNRDNRDRRDGGRDRDRGDRGGRDRARRDDRGPRRDRDGPGGPPGGSGPGLGPLIGGLGGGNLNGLGALGSLGGLGAPPLGAPLGAQLGGPLGAPLGGLGILSAVNTLAAVAEKKQRLDSTQQQPSQQTQRQQQPQAPPSQAASNKDQPDPDVRVRREVVHTRDVPNAAAMGLGSGYVIYERYYVDGNHRLLQGLPLSQLPRMSDNRPVPDNPDTKQAYLNEVANDMNQSQFRDRSPVSSMYSVNGAPDYRRNYDQRR